jgi:tetratricopeptide (TPR) repeat protein
MCTRSPIRYSLASPWLLVCLVLLPGCVSWRALQPVPPSVAAGRRLSRQGVAAMEVNRWDEAEQYFASAVDKAPEDPEARRYLAEALWRRGATSEALDHIAVAASLDADDASTAVRAGEMLLEAGEAQRAIEQADQAVRLDNTLASAWTLRGRAYLAKGDDDRALADMQRALLLAPNSADVLYETAKLYHSRGQHQRCLATLHRLQDTSSSAGGPPEVLELEGRTYLALGRPRLAADCLAKASQQGGTSTELATLQAEAAQQLSSRPLPPLH